MQSSQNNQIHLWPNALYRCQSNDWTELQQQILAVCQQRDFSISTLGYTAEQPVYLATRAATAANAKSILIASGFHGEEPAGPWGLLHALETIDKDVLDAVNIAVLPLVNISGFSCGTRFNHKGENPNRGYLALDDGTAISEEGQILLCHQSKLALLGCDGVLSCHEDVSKQHGYIYANEHGEVPSALAVKLRNSNARFFPLHADGLVDDCMVSNGMVFNHKDSSFEAWLFEHGATHTYCTETPGQGAFDQRLLANASMIKTFIEYHA